MNDKYEKLENTSVSDDKLDAKIVELEKRLEETKEKLREERFCYLIVFTIILNVFFFQCMKDWGGPIAILILELVLLFIIARKFRIEDLTNILDKYIANGRFSKKHQDKE